MFWSELSSPNGFALTMIAILALALGTVCMVLLTVVRNAHRKLGPEDLLIEEAYRRANPPPKPAVVNEAPVPESPSQPWERDADWWQSGKSGRRSSE